MDAEFRTPALLRAIKAAARVAKPLGKAVNGALIEVAANLTISATDASTTVMVSLPGDVKAPGRCAIDAQRLARAVAAISGDAVRLKLKADSLAVSGGGGRFELPIMPLDALPRMVIPEAPPFLTADARELAAWIGDAAYCAGHDEGRPTTLGVHVEAEGKTIRAVSTNGSQLSMVGFDRDPGQMQPWRVPDDALTSALESCDGETSLSRKDDRLVVASGGYRFALPMYDAAGFPPYRQVMPTVKHRMKVPRAALNEALGGMLVVADDKTAGVTLGFGKELTVTATGTGEASFTVPGEWDGKKAETIHVNIVYLMQALEHVHAEFVTLGWTGDLDPFMVGDGALVMPSRPGAK